MNTEQRILAMLSKIEKVQAVKKENLGAIEDAINESKSRLTDLRDEMVAVNRQLESAISVAEEVMAQAVSNLSDAIRESDQQFNLLQEDAFVLTNELDDLGISYDVDVNKIVDDYLSLFDKADSMI